MKKIYKKAFTLAEILIVMTIVGILTAVLMHNLRLSQFDDKKFKAGAVKVIQEFNIASAKIRDLETTKCPTGNFVIDIMGDKEYALTTNGSTLMTTTTDVLDLFGEYIKLDHPSDYYNFCDYTGWEDCPENVKGVKMAGDIYVGLKVTATTTSMSACPDYYIIDTSAKDKEQGKANENTLIQAGTDKNCWANLYMDINGKQGPNKLGEDVFVYGLDKDGVFYEGKK